MAKQRAVIEKIKKLLALADLEKNNNINEALNAACVAQTLMSRHRLSYEKIMFEANGFNTNQEEIVDYIKHFGTYFGMPNPSDWSKALVKVIADHNECLCYSTKLSGILREGRETEEFAALSLVGREEDILMVEELYFYLELEISKICIEEWSKSDLTLEDEDSKKRYADFCLGAVAQLHLKFEELDKAEKEVSEEYKYAVIRLEKKRQDLKSFFTKFKFEKAGKSARANSTFYYDKGYRAAEKIPVQLNKTSIIGL